jgi:hypothetical protein
MLLEIFVATRIQRTFGCGNGNIKVSSHPDLCTEHIFQDLREVDQTWLFGKLGPLSSTKFARWSYLRGRFWTAKRELPHNDKCVYCDLTQEDANHLFMNCVVVNIIWNSVLSWLDCSRSLPA